MTVPIALMRKFPNFELIFSGGKGRLVPTGTTEAELAGVFYTEQGVDIKQRHSLPRRLSHGGRNFLDGVFNGWQFDGLADCAA